MGMGSGFFIGCSRILINYVLEIGPAGGTLALINISNSIFLIIIQAIRN